MQGRFSLANKREEGILNESKTKGYEVGTKLDSGFTVSARALKIDASNVSQYWQWTSSEGVEVANAVRLKHVGVYGSFDTIVLTYGRPYKVSFLLKTTSSGNMKGQPVNLTLTLPNGVNQENPAFLPGPSGDWLELEVGQFEMASELVGQIQFAMKQDFQDWKGGLTIKGVQIKPLQTKAK